MKKLILLILIVFCPLLLCSCTMILGALSDALENAGTDSSFYYESDVYGEEDDFNYEDDAEYIDVERTYYNKYLGVGLTLPEDSWVYSVNESNFSESEHHTEDYASLDVYQELDYSYIDLISFSNLQYSRYERHIGIELYAERVSWVSTLQEYADYTTDYMTEYDEEYYEYVLNESSEEQLCGVTFARRVFTVTNPDAPYRVMILICEVGEGYFLTIYSDYWENNARAEELMFETIESRLILDDYSPVKPL